MSWYFLLMLESQNKNLPFLIFFFHTTRMYTIFQKLLIIFNFDNSLRLENIV